jgi:trk system potassium uptake protein TrkA
VRIAIVGCGRVGASAAESWDAAGHDVIVLDVLTSAFERLPTSFKGTAFRGDGTDEDVLRRAGVTDADVFLALTEGDNRNIMSAQLATEALGVGTAIAKINDPLRADAYAELGVATLCRTGLMLDAVNAHIGLPPSGIAGMQAASGHHPGGHHDGTDAAPSSPAAPASLPTESVSAAPPAAGEA